MGLEGGRRDGAGDQGVSNRYKEGIGGRRGEGRERKGDFGNEERVDWSTKKFIRFYEE